MRSDVNINIPLQYNYIGGGFSALRRHWDPEFPLRGRWDVFFETNGLNFTQKNPVLRRWISNLRLNSRLKKNLVVYSTIAYFEFWFWIRSLFIPLSLPNLMKKLPLSGCWRRELFQVFRKELQLDTVGNTINKVWELWMASSLLLAELITSIATTFFLDLGDKI